MRLSHFERYVRDVGPMAAIDTRCLGFVVTDRGEGPDGMVFLSHNPDEHHQLVLNPRPERRASESPLDHRSFRVASLDRVRTFHTALVADSDAPVETVTHGTTWSIYFRDPEGNRLEVFADTPWHMNQPCRFPIDLALGDEALHEYTLAKIRDLPGFRPVEAWRKSHAGALGGSTEASRS